MCVPFTHLWPISGKSCHSGSGAWLMMFPCKRPL
uniref:Uncharacterized protein n=1 Tax=Anguilla anguilla TaxID=7936 RepID=A0A0E9S042_ANGAN